MTMLFKELPVGARFEFRGRRYEKIALSMARDEERCGNVFHGHAEVCVDNEAEGGKHEVSVAGREVRR